MQAAPTGPGQVRGLGEVRWPTCTEAAAVTCTDRDSRFTGLARGPTLCSHVGSDQLAPELQASSGVSPPL